MPEILPSASGGEQRPTTAIADAVESCFAPSSPWSLMWEEAEQTLLNDHPEGFYPEDIGRLAWQSLHEDFAGPALNQLFYGYWVLLQDQPEIAARTAAEQSARDGLRELVREYETRLVLGAEVTPDLTADIVSLARILLGGAR